MRHLPPGVRHCTLNHLPPQPWRNGGGLTRVVAEEEAGRWRVSIADITRDSPYSAFTGMERLQVLLEGGRVELQSPGWEARLLRPLDQARFDGELAVRARVPQGPARVWNLMLARGHVRGEVRRVAPGAVRLGGAPGELVRLLHVIQGQPRVAETALGPDSVLVCQGDDSADAFVQVGPNDLILLTCITEIDR